MASIQNFFIRLFLRATTKKNQVAKQPVEVTRTRIAKLMSMAKLPNNIVFEKENCDGIDAEWSVPAELKSDSVILYLHGGAYVSCSIDTHRPLVGRLAKAAHCKALSINYGLAPEHPFPAGLDDAITAYNWLLKNGYKNSQIVIVGDSAGGGLTIATLLKMRDSGIALPAAAVCMSPWLDLTCSHDSGVRLDKKDLMLSAEAGKVFASFYAGKEDVKHPYISPYYADLKGLPPLLIHVSDSEIVLDENVGFAKKAKESGVDIQFEIWKGMTHVWHGYAPILPEAISAINKIGKYIQQRTS
jgi:epsilon-lactone hydrolase